MLLKGKARLGSLVHKKNCTAVALTASRPEDKSQIDLLCKSFRNQFNDNANLKKTWGGGILGLKSQSKIDKRQAAMEQEALKKANIWWKKIIMFVYLIY